MVAVQKKMDILGVVILGVTTAIGGGITRDILMGVTPPQSLTNPLYAGISIAVSLLIFFPPIRGRINVDIIAFVALDALGVGGGVLRDIFAAEKPTIFIKRFYAVASLIGAIVCTIVYPFYKNSAMVLGIIIIIILRVLAAKFKWNLPRVD